MTTQIIEGKDGNSGLYKTIFTGSAAHSYLAKMWGGYDASKVSIPWFMTAAAGTSDDTGATDAVTEWLGVAPLSIESVQKPCSTRS